MAVFSMPFHREGIGRFKADAPNVARESIGIFRNHLDRVGTIRLVNPHRRDVPTPLAYRKIMN